MKIKMMTRSGLLLCLLLLCSTMLQAEVKLSPLFADGMVLQRQAPCILWGSADAGERVVVRLLNKKYETVADVRGQWTVTLPAQSAGGPYDLQVNAQTLQNVLFGDVYLCSGQSNMELPVSRVMDLFADEVKQSSNPSIRYLQVPRAYDFHAPQSTFRSSVWRELTPQNSLSFGAVAYFFAKALYAKTHVPVGIINAAVGGSPIEAWVDENHLKPYPHYLSDLKMCQDDDYVAAVKQMDERRNSVWNRTLYTTPAPTTEAWQPMSLFSAAWTTDGLKPKHGTHFFRRKVELTAEQASQAATLRLGCIVDADSVFVNGHFVGTTAYQYPPRIYTVPRGVLRTGQNEVEIRLVSYAGIPCFVPDKPYKLLLSDGSEVSLLQGWEYKPGVRMPALAGGVTYHYKPTGLYNGMIAPLQPLRLAGVIWYQGESNVDRYHEYASLMGALIDNWRTAFHQPQMPFFIIELAGFLHPQDSAQPDWAALRAAQAQAAQTHRDVMLIRNRDLGEWNDIHPLDKKTLGARIAEAAHQQINQ